MRRDHDLITVRYFIERGHSIRELESLTPLEWEFFKLHAGMVAEAQRKILEDMPGEGG
jgi:hypothetical protein